MPSFPCSAIIVQMKGEQFLHPLTPALVARPWGGTRLNCLFGKETQGESIGEAWSVSIHQSAPAKIGHTPLNQILSQEQLPYLVKFIDTADNLSLQVHPHEDFARREENGRGKNECWLILKAEEESRIYLGPKRGVAREQFALAAEAGEDLLPYLYSKRVVLGDFFYIPAGTLHAIGKNIFLVEVQNNSDITYRVWDWHRSRPLHLKKAMEVIHFGGGQERIERGLWQRPGKTELLAEGGLNVTLFNLSPGEEQVIDNNFLERIGSVVILEGEGELEQGNSRTRILPYQSYLLGENAKLFADSGLCFLYIY